MKEQLKIKIINANNAYRSGTSIISDAEYDYLLEQYQQLVSETEYLEFLNSLHEKTGKVKHPFIMGSLDKLKAEEPENVKKFLSKLKTINVSAKVDGISCRLHYENGKLISGSTRGDGTFGESLGDKINFIKYIPKHIPCLDTLDIRGELVILNKDYSEYFEATFSNPRNAVAGLINRKEWNPDDIGYISFIGYTILGPTYTKKQQFEILNSCEFKTAWYKDDLNYSDDIVDELYNLVKQDYEYLVDGLVLCDNSYCNEEKYRPDNCVAFKINEQIATTRLIDVVFEGPSENGYFIPVAILEPVEIGNVVVNRCTLHNLDFIKEKNLKYGCTVSILRSGDVIPKLIEVLDTIDGACEIEYPSHCTCCDSELIRDGVNLRCLNKDCSDQIIHQITHFIKKLGIKSVSEKTIVNFNISSFKDLLAFRPDKKYKSQTKFYDELLLKLFTRSKQELLAATQFNGLSEILVNKIVDFYGLENIEQDKYTGLPYGVGELILDKFRDNVKENLDLVNVIINDSRYNHTIQMVSKKEIIGSVCFTGKLYTMSRNDASKKAIEAGYEVKNTVSAGLTYLVTNDTESNSSKNKKAKQLGTKVINEEEFIQLCDSKSIELDLFKI